MDYPMSEDDPESSAAMNNSQQNAGRCPYRSSVDGAVGSVSTQPGWSHPHFGGSTMASVPMNAFHPGPYHYWDSTQAAAQQLLQGPRQPYGSHNTHSSSSSANSEYNTQENRSHEEPQSRSQSRAQHTENSRPAMPRVFTSPERFVGPEAAEGVQIGQSGQQQTASLTSSPSQIPVPSNSWATFPVDNTGRPVGGYYPTQLGFLPRPPQFGLQQHGQGLHPRQLPQPNITSHTSANGSAQARHLQMSQNGQSTMNAYYGSFSMQVANVPPHIIAAHDRQHRAAVAAVLNPPEPEDSDDDSDGSEDDDEDTDSSPPRFTGRTSISRSQTRAEAQAAYFAATEADVLRERQRAARRAQLHNVKSVAHPGYIETLEKVDLKTLDGDELTCMICYNDFGVKNPEGIIEVAVRLNKCKHVLGENCLKKWFEDSDSCPYCRDKVPSMQKSRARLHRLDPSRPGSSLLDGRYASLSIEERALERAAFHSHYGETSRFYAHVMGHQAGFLGSELPRHYPQGERDEMVDNLRVNQERLEALLYPHGAPLADPFSRHTIPEHRERYERMLYQRHDDNSLAGASSGAYATRPVPQYERRRQARVRAASRGAISVNSGSTSNAATTQAGLRMSSMSDYGETSRQGAARSSHSAHSSFDSASSSGGAPRSITPHPTILDGSAGALNAHLNPLNPAAPPWNGMRTSMQSQPQPTGPPTGSMAQAPDSPSRAVFGYYQTNRGSLPPTPTRGGGLDGWRNTSASNSNQNNNVSTMPIVDGSGQANNTSNAQNGWQAAAQAAGAVAGSIALTQVMGEGVYNFVEDRWGPLEEMDGQAQVEGQGEVDVEMADLADGGF